MKATGTWMLVVMFVGFYFGLAIGWRLRHIDGSECGPVGSKAPADPHPDGPGFAGKVQNPPAP